MQEYNDIGISRQTDVARIKKLLKIGLLFALVHFVTSFICGLCVNNTQNVVVGEKVSPFNSASDIKIIVSAFLAFLSVLLEGLSLFGIYRLMAEKSPKCAHLYRTGIFGYMLLGSCGVCLPSYAFMYLCNHVVDNDVVRSYATIFILPVTILFAICIVILSIVQAYAIIKSYTFVGKWAWMFCLPIGMAMAKIVGFCGSSPFFYGISCASLAVGNIWMFGGLLIATKISESKEVNKENV